MKTCKDCKWWEKLNKEKYGSEDEKREIGVCHRFPPPLVPNKKSYELKDFVLIDETWWCGEFTEKVE